MRVVHDPPGESSRVLATDVERADSLVSKGLGLMFRGSIPEDYALVFSFDGVGTRRIHAGFVRFPFDVVWTVEGEVVRTETMGPWLGLGSASADRVIEFPAGTADGVEAGDLVRVVAEGTGDG